MIGLQDHNMNEILLGAIAFTAHVQQQSLAGGYLLHGGPESS
jgi:hypothetical protein